ncbi:MAG: peptide ABC transporter substrate-binding protein [Candidatus Dormibacteraceae bacterium]
MRHIRSLRLLALASAAATVTVACGGASGPGGNGVAAAPASQQVLRINEGVEPNSYDPTQQTYTYEAAVGRNTFEALLKAKTDGSDVTGAAAQSYDVSPDGLTYTFHLRTNGKWSDGKPVTAQDFVYGWKHLLNPALAAGYVDPFFDGTIAGGQNYATLAFSKTTPTAAQIDSFLNGLGLSAPDSHTFVVKLQHKAAYFKWVCTLWVGVPLRADVVNQAAGGTAPASTDTAKLEAWAQNASTIVGNGPFKIQDIVTKDHVDMVPNTYYWNGAPKIQKLTYFFISDANTAYSLYKTGGLDILNVPLADVTTVRGDPKLSKEAHLYPTLSTFWMTFNSKVKPFDKALVRMAFAKSIDRNLLVNNVEHGTDKAWQSFIPKGMPGVYTGDNAQSFDPAAARADLQKAGVQPSAFDNIKLLTRATTGNETINQFIVAQWNTNLHTNIKLDVLDSHTVTTHIRHGQFDIYGPDGWGADYPDQQDWFDIFTTAACGSLNWGCVGATGGLPGYDALVAKADTNLNASQRAQEYLKAQKQLIDTATVGFIYQQYEYDLVKPYVANMTKTPTDDEYTPGDLHYDTIYIAKH